MVDWMVCLRTESLQCKLKLEDLQININNKDYKLKKLKASKPKISLILIKDTLLSNNIGGL